MLNLRENGITMELGTVSHRMAPDTFGIPCEDCRMNVPIDTFVKVMFTGKDDFTERMWVKVTGIVTDGVYEGTLANQPFGEKEFSPLEFGSEIEFASEHIIDITGDVAPDS
ncbi:MAG TPA: hypothetical protein EYQ21_00700 [Flavobacteriales bacterium]|nr:hypothetical protein [Flavobacteriales bacterium]